MKDLIHRIWVYLRNTFLMPARLAKLGSRLSRIEESVDASDAFLFYALLEKKWPEAAEAFLPDIQLPPEAVAELSGYYSNSNGPQALQNNLNRHLVQMAENLIYLPLAGKTALFEEAVARPASSRPWAMGRYLTFMAKYGLEDEAILKIAARFEALDSSIWDPGYEEVWAIYLAVLLRSGAEEKALDILKRHARKYKLRKLEQVPPAASFAKACGFSNELIDQAAALVDLLKIGQPCFKELVASKSLAVVGNSPLEIGRGRGREIDSHDMVLRFNHFQAESSYKTDFGEKCSILSKNYAEPFALASFAHLKFIFLPEGVARYPVPLAATKMFLQTAHTCGCSLATLPLSNFREMLRQTDFIHFSTGLMTAAYLKSLKPDLSPGNFYGFSHFLDQQTENYDAYQPFHYYASRSEDLDTTALHSHPLKKEREFLQNLLNS